MTKRFTIASNIRNGYAAMGNSLRRPKISGQKHRTVAESIAKARATAARMAAANTKKKK